MVKNVIHYAAGVFAMALVAPAMAGEGAPSDQMTIEQASQHLHYSGGNDRLRVEIAPNYSEELGWSLKGAAGGYLTDEVALGLIVEYGEDKREYLANAGIQFTDALSLVGTVGMLEEHIRFFEEEDKEVVQQMEYGASFKGEFDAGLFSGFELNGYLADADTDYEFADVGKVYGIQLLGDFDLTDSTHLALGGGYEWLEWDDGEGDQESWTLSADASQRLTDALTLNARAKLGVTENVYGGGLAFDLSNGGPNSNMIALNYLYIDGHEGIEDDQRVELGWTIGFGAGPTSTVASADLTDNSGTIRASADAATVYPANNLLADVMKRPSFLPERVIARSSASETSSLECYSDFINDPASMDVVHVGVWYVDSGDDVDPNPESGDDSIDIDSENKLGVGTFDLYLSQSLDSFENPALLKAGARLGPDLNDSVVPVTVGLLNWNPDTRYQYNESIWAFVDDNGVCKALVWGED